MIYIINSMSLCGSGSFFLTPLFRPHDPIGWKAGPKDMLEGILSGSLDLRILGGRGRDPAVCWVHQLKPRKSCQLLPYFGPI